MTVAMAMCFRLFIFKLLNYKNGTIKFMLLKLNFEKCINAREPVLHKRLLSKVRDAFLSPKNYHIMND